MKTDARIRYTKMVIRDSLLKLLAEKPIQKITVKEICELAQINRATFYTHYRDPFDLLEQIENELFEDISAVRMGQNDATQLTKEIFGVIQRNADLCKILFSENGDKLFLRRIMDISRHRIISYWNIQYPHATQQQLDFLYAFVVNGSVGVIEEWVRNGMQKTPIELGEIAAKTVDSWLRVKK